MIKRTIIGVGMVLAVASAPVTAAAAERSALLNAWYWTVAVGVNLIPGVSAIYAPKCLPGYILCKVSYAGMSAVIAAEHLFWGGGARPQDRKAILHRGFAGDWIAKADHIAGDLPLEPYPESAPGEDMSPGGGGFEPPPL